MTRPMARLAAVLALLAVPSSAQTLLELRGSTTDYRFVDLSHAFKSRVVVDLLYTGVPGQDELYFGLGYQLKLGWLTLTPIAYGVAGFQNEQRGATLGALIYGDGGGWRSAGFAGRFFRFDGDVNCYSFADSLDFTRVIGKWELGASFGFFEQSGDFSWLLGPTVKLNDAHGVWSLAARWGAGETELRLIRVVTF